MDVDMDLEAPVLPPPPPVRLIPPPPPAPTFAAPMVTPAPPASAPMTPDAFYEAFGIQPGDPMWRDPKQRVVIW